MRTLLRGGTVVDGTGMVVAPGFIDMHAHSDLRLLTEPSHLAKISQGVTTELLAIDEGERTPALAGRALRRRVDGSTS